MIAPAGTVDLSEWIIDDTRLVDPRGRPQSRRVVITIFTHSVRLSQNFEIKHNHCWPGLDWPSGSLMTPVLCYFVFMLMLCIQVSLERQITQEFLASAGPDGSGESLCKKKRKMGRDILHFR